MYSNSAGEFAETLKLAVNVFVVYCRNETDCNGMHICTESMELQSPRSTRTYPPATSGVRPCLPL